jgi:putative membrane protein
MGTRAFFSSDAKKRVEGAIAEVELASAAEIVVALRHASGHYRHTDYLVGAFAALIALSVFLYHPEPFDYTWLPLELVALFAVAALASSALPPLRRALTSRKLMDESVGRAARALFVDKRVDRTRGRTGILVYLSALERRVDVVADIGVDEAALGERWALAKEQLGEALVAGSLDAFVDALRGLGPVLGEALPRAADDENELPDEVAS